MLRYHHQNQHSHFFLKTDQKILKNYVKVKKMTLKKWTYRIISGFDPLGGGVNRVTACRKEIF